MKLFDKVSYIIGIVSSIAVAVLLVLILAPLMAIAGYLAAGVCAGLAVYYITVLVMNWDNSCDGESY